MTMHEIDEYISGNVSSQLFWARVYAMMGSVSNLSKKTGIPENTIRVYKYRSSWPSVENIIRIALALDIDVRFLLMGGSSMIGGEDISAEESAIIRRFRDNPTFREYILAILNNVN